MCTGRQRVCELTHSRDGISAKEKGKEKADPKTIENE